VPDLYTYELVEAMSRPGSPICRVIADTEQADILSIFREGRLDPDFRRRFFATGGFCRLHAWMLEGVARSEATGAPVADLYGALVVQDLETATDATAKDDRRFARRRAGLRPVGPCIACERVEDSLVRKADFLAAALEDETIRELYRRSDGLCYLHLLPTLEAADPGSGRFLLEDWRSRLERVDGLLREYQRKRDYRYADEPRGEEQRSWTEAVARYVGRRVSLDSH
jgi:uncharacterized protein DUF6062